MASFGPSAFLIPVVTTEAKLETPLGEMVFRVRVGESVLGIESAFRNDGGIELRRYSHATADVELLLFPFAPKLPEGMRVDRCVAAVWRATSKEDGVSLAFQAEWASGAKSVDGGPESGEHLTALTWTAPDVRVTVGTSDEEMLAYAAEEGFLPVQLAPVFRAEGGYYARTFGELGGLEVALPPLLMGETAQAHMVLAWVMGDLKADECSPWFAVGVPPREIARMADVAFGT